MITNFYNWLRGIFGLPPVGESAETSTNTPVVTDAKPTATRNPAFNRPRREFTKRRYNKYLNNNRGGYEIYDEWNEEWVSEDYLVTDEDYRSIDFVGLLLIDDFFDEVLEEFYEEEVHPVDVTLANLIDDDPADELFDFELEEAIELVDEYDPEPALFEEEPETVPESPAFKVDPAPEYVPEPEPVYTPPPAPAYEPPPAPEPVKTTTDYTSGFSSPSDGFSSPSSSFSSDSPSGGSDDW